MCVCEWGWVGGGEEGGERSIPHSARFQKFSHDFSLTIKWLFVLLSHNEAYNLEPGSVLLSPTYRDLNPKFSDRQFWANNVDPELTIKVITICHEVSSVCLILDSLFYGTVKPHCYNSIIFRVSLLQQFFGCPNNSDIYGSPRCWGL